MTPPNSNTNEVKVEDLSRADIDKMLQKARNERSDALGEIISKKMDQVAAVFGKSKTPKP